MDKSHYVKQTLENARVNYTWRFFSDSSHQWRWERLAFDGTVVEHSQSSFPQYESCVANATESGYVFVPSSSTKAPSASKPKRSYVRIPSTPHKPVSKA